MRGAVGVALAALAGGVALLPWALRAADAARLAAGAGFASVAIPTVAGAALLARTHGRAGHGFLVALGVAMAARLALAAGTLIATGIRLGSDAMGPAALGIAAGFVPAIAYEVAWFARARSEAPAAGTRA